MVKIRLKRMGYKRNPIFRIVVIDVRSKREGAPIEELGYYNPKRKELKLNKESALEWVKKGAQPTETVQYLINNCNEEGGLIVKEKAKKLSKKAQAKLEAETAAKAEAEKAAKEAAAAPAEEPAAEEATAEA
jgi:small subunit ribosomal protein S16